MMNIKKPLAGFVFDMDGLMYDTERVIMNSWDTVGVQMGFGPLGSYIYDTLGMSRASREDYFHSKFGKDFPYKEFQDRYAAETYRLTTDSIPVKPGLDQLLDYLKKCGYPLAVATSSSRQSALRKLRSNNLTDCFSVMICGDMVKKAKPDPEIYLIACRELKIPPEQLIALEDSINGLQSALSAGMMAIMIPDLIKDCPQIEPCLEAKLPSLADVISFVENNYYPVKYD